MVTARPACSRPVSSTERVTPSLVWNVRRDGDSAALRMGTTVTSPSRLAPATSDQRPRRWRLPMGDEQTRPLTFPVIAKREGKLGHMAPGLVGGFEVRLVPVVELPDRPVITAVEPDPPGGLVQEAVRDSGVVLNDEVSAGQDHVARLLELAVVQQVGRRLQQ